MIIFVDESGDPGFKTRKGSSPHFVIAMVIFDDQLDAEEAALVIKKLRRKLKRSDRYEFKFNKCDKKHRLAFLEEVAGCKFRTRAIVFRKEVIYNNYLRESKDSFYNFALRQVLEHNGDTILNAKIRLDGRGERAFRDSLVVYLRRSLNSKTRKVMKNLRFRDSRSDVLIQLADMISGSIRRYYDHATGDWDIYRKVIKKREEDVWLFK